MTLVRILPARARTARPYASPPRVHHPVTARI